MINVINIIENDESLLKWFTFAFKRLTKITTSLDVESMVKYLYHIYNFELDMMIPIAKAYHTLNSMIVYTASGRQLVYKL